MAGPDRPDLADDGAADVPQDPAKPHDVDPQQYATVIREMIRHENDLTNHRIMWLLIVQGLFANAYVNTNTQKLGDGAALAVIGITVTLSAFLMLYKSYHARGYLVFLGGRAKLGLLCEKQLPLTGWPRERMRGWRKGVWACPWLNRTSDLLEPYFFLPTLLNLLWLFQLLRMELGQGTTLVLFLALALDLLILGSVCITWLSLAGMDRQIARPDAPEVE